MKRWLFLIAALLLLCGCAAETEETIPAPILSDPISPSTTEPIGYYDPDSALEASTDGAIRAYPLNRSDSYAVVAMAEDLLLLSGKEVTTLSRLTGDSLYVSAAANLDCYIPADSPAFHAGPRGVTYYDELHRQLVYLDTGLKEVSRFSLPGTAIGAPALTADRKTLYYCTENSIRAIDLETGLDKLLRQTAYASQSITGLHWGNTVLECSTEDSYGNIHTVFISAETGETLYGTSGYISLMTKDTSYFAIHQEGAYLEKLTGTEESGPNMLVTAEYDAVTEFIPELNAAIEADFTEYGTQLNCYDLTSGLRSHSICLPDTEKPWNMLGDPKAECIWFLRHDAEYESDILCRWNLGMTSFDDKNVYLSSRCTAAEPDCEGLDALKKEAAALGSKFGMEILLWTDATSPISNSYRVEAEYQVPLLKRYLEILDKTLSAYPANFLRQINPGSGTIRIGLVRSISPVAASVSDPDIRSGFQFRDAHDNIYIITAIGDQTAASLYNNLAQIMDNQVLISCSNFDDWEDLNPDNFEYSFSYRIPSDLDETLFQGEARAFIDPASTTFPREDRAKIMEYAMQEDNEEVFESAIMQKKLRKLCQGIRKAFGLTKSSESFIWEQYLEKPLAKK